MSDKKKSLIRRLFDFLWGAALGFYRLLMILSVVIFIGVLWTAFRGGPAPTIENNVALVIWPAGQVVEQADPELRIIERVLREEPSQTVLRDLVEAIDAAAKDPRIARIVLKLDTMDGIGAAQASELVSALERFRQAGKQVHAHGPYYSQSGYRIAAAADDVSLDPLGGVLMEGFSAYQNYFKDGLDKLGVKMNVFRVGEFKSAVEPFIRNDMSDEARAANREWLGDLWQDYTASITGHRELEAEVPQRYVDEFRESIASFKGDAAGYARHLGLVTHIETLQEFRQRVGEFVGMDEEHGSFRQVHHAEYLNAVWRKQRKLHRQTSLRDIALVVVEGQIVDGPGEPGEAGGDVISGLLEDARRDDSVAAVVLRVNSPGGSVWASEQIRREVQALVEQGKPVVASMGAVAASGGYWVSMDADQIFASPSTITGSIGIFGLIPTIEKPLEDLGIHTDGVGTTSLAGAFRIDRPLSDDVSAIFQSQVEKGYRDFIEGVSEARDIPLEQVQTIAEGRVWSGLDAKDHGLIDSFGGLDQAVSAAASRAGLNAGQWRLVEFSPFDPFPSGLFGSLFGGLRSLLAQQFAAATGPVTAVLGKTDLLGWIQRFNDPRGLYAHCMCGSTGANAALAMSP